MGGLGSGFDFGALGISVNSSALSSRSVRGEDEQVPEFVGKIVEFKFREVSLYHSCAFRFRFSFSSSAAPPVDAVDKTSQRQRWIDG